MKWWFDPKSLYDEDGKRVQLAAQATPIKKRLRREIRDMYEGSRYSVSK